MTSDKPSRPAMLIRRAVAEATGFAADDLARPYQARCMSGARFMAMWLTRRATDYGLKRIAGQYGYRDHTSVLYAIERFEQMRDRDEGLRKLSDALLSQFQEN